MNLRNTNSFQSVFMIARIHVIEHFSAISARSIEYIYRHKYSCCLTMLTEYLLG